MANKKCILQFKVTGEMNDDEIIIGDKFVEDIIVIDPETYNPYYFARFKNKIPLDELELHEVNWSIYEESRDD